jgi:hypothetical protein
MPIKYVVNTADFDSTLGQTPDIRDNATTLEITLKLEFIAVDAQTAKDLSGKVFRMRPWEDGAIRQYITDFKDSVESHWSDRIYILFPDPKDAKQAMNKLDYQRFLHPTLKDKKPPYMKCMLSIQPCDKNGHAKVYILNVVPGQGRFQGRAYRRPDAPDTLTVGSDALKIATHRISDRDTYRQVPAVHEVGHLLDLDHVNAADPACKTDKNAEICYGGTPYEMNDIMGMGDAVTGDHAKTWLKAIRLHTQHDKGWTASHLSPPLLELLDLNSGGRR